MSVPTRHPQRGTWGFVIDVAAIDGARRQVRRRGFPTRKAALEAQRLLLDEAANGTIASPTTLTVGEYLEGRWLPTLPGRVRPTTVDTYRRAVTCQIVPRIGSVRLQSLDGRQVQGVVASMAADGRSPKYTRNVIGTLSKALGDAVKWHLVGQNVASGVDLPQMTPGLPKAWDAAQLVRFLTAATDDRLGPLWRFIALTGCRRGEALGLRWSDVDLEAGTAAIVRQRVIAGGSVVEGPPKTRAGARTVALDADTVATLRSWKASQTAEYLRLGVRPDHGLVFTGEDGRPLWPQRISATFKRTALELGLPAIGVHGLRHSAATWLIGSGVSPKTVAHRLGHSTPSITLAIYSHVLPGFDQAAVDALAVALSPTAPGIPVTRM